MRYGYEQRADGRISARQDAHSLCPEPNDTWFTSTSEVPRKEVRDFAKKNGIKVIRNEYLL